MNVGYIADSKGSVTDTNRKVADLFHRLEVTRHAQLHALARGFKEAGSGDRVLLLQRLLHSGQRQAKGGELEVGQLDPDLLVL